MRLNPVCTSAALMLTLAGAAIAQPAFDAERADRADRAERAERQAQPEARERGQDGRKARMIERFDADGDGQLSEAERDKAKAHMQARRAERKAELEARLLPRFDDNDDGTLDESEWAAVKEAIGPMMREARERGQRGGKQAGTRRHHMHREALKQFDADGDGELNETEKTAAKAHFKAKKAAIVERFDADGDGDLTGELRQAARAHHREQRMLDINRDGTVDAMDLQAATDRLASGERIRDYDRSGTADAADIAALAERIRAFPTE